MLYLKETMFFFCSAALLLYASHKNKMTLNTYSNRYYYQKDNVFIRGGPGKNGGGAIPDEKYPLRLKNPLIPFSIAKLIVVMSLIKQCFGP